MDQYVIMPHERGLIFANDSRPKTIRTTSTSMVFALFLPINNFSKTPAKACSGPATSYNTQFLLLVMHTSPPAKPYPAHPDLQGQLY